MLVSLLQKAGQKPALLPLSNRPSKLTKVTLIASLLSGTGSMFASAPAQAASYNCVPNSTGSGALIAIPFGQVAPTTNIQTGDTITCADKLFTIGNFDFKGATGDVEFEWVENPPSGYTADSFSVDIDFTPAIGSAFSPGFFNYTLAITNPSYTFDTIQLDSTIVSGAGGDIVVTKTVNGTLVLTSTNGSKDGPITIPYTSPISIEDSWSIPAGSTLDNVKDSVTQTSSVPGPLPLLGAGAAFGFSRRLRSRIRNPRLRISGLAKS